MTDLTEYFTRAREMGLWGEGERERVLDIIGEKFPRAVISTDEGAGENWVMLSCPGYDTYAMLHRRLRIIFWHGGELPELPGAVTIRYDSYGERRYKIDPDRIAEVVPELDWNVSSEAVRPGGFSLQELYFATV